MKRLRLLLLVLAAPALSWVSCAHYERDINATLECGQVYRFRAVSPASIEAAKWVMVYALTKDGFAMVRVRDNGSAKWVTGGGKEGCEPQDRRSITLVKFYFNPPPGLTCDTAFARPTAGMAIALYEYAKMHAKAPKDFPLTGDPETLGLFLPYDSFIVGFYEIRFPDCTEMVKELNGNCAAVVKARLQQCCLDSAEAKIIKAENDLNKCKKMENGEDKNVCITNATGPVSS